MSADLRIDCDAVCVDCGAGVLEPGVLACAACMAKLRARIGLPESRPDVVNDAIAAFADRIADEIERRIATRNGATAAALAEVAEIVRSAGRQT